jgi:hypothetical protein
MLENSVQDIVCDFTYQLDVFGQKKIIELVPGGKNILVNEDNKK